MPNHHPRLKMCETFQVVWGIGHGDTIWEVSTDFKRGMLDSKYKWNRWNNLEVFRYPDDAGFRPFSQSALSLIGKMKRANRGPSTNWGIVEYFRDEGIPAMQDVLENVGINATALGNAPYDVATSGDIPEADQAEMMVTLFVAAGCTADPRLAVEEMAQVGKHSGARYLTVDQGDDLWLGESARGASTLALLRVDPEGDGGRYVVPPEGVVVGRQATDADDISDVSGAVSKRHLRIWRDHDGTWLVQGLGSRNGTVLIPGDGSPEIVVEPPSSEYRGESDPVPLGLGDRLVLAGTTVFWVQMM